jgi:glycosyltransferase involved in cell wall biosynthesis
MTTRAPFLSGAEVALGHLAGGLSAAGHKVIVICGQDGPVRQMLADRGLDARVIPLHNTDRFHPLRFWRTVRALRKILREHQCDIVHSNDIPSFQAISLAAKREGVPRVCHARFLIQPEGARWFLKYGVEQVVAVSQYLKGHLMEAAPDVFDGKIAVSLDGMNIPAPPTDGDRQAARRQLTIPADRFVFLFVGQFSQIKGVADLIEAVALLPEDLRARCAFYLVGDDLQNAGQYRREMIALAEKKLPGGPIHFPGFRKNVPAWLAACDCVVVPSRIDPLGMTVMESMAAACAVIGAAVGGIPEMVQPNTTGQLVPPATPPDLAAAIATMAQDPRTAHQMGQAGYQRAIEIFSLQKHVGEVVNIYDELLSR